MDLKKRLDYHYRYFDFDKISPDPLEFPHRYENKYDIEISAFISSIFAYGNVKQIISVLEKIHKVMVIHLMNLLRSLILQRDEKN